MEVIRAEEKAVDEEDDSDDKLLQHHDEDEDDEADEYGLQGRIRITTRCLWTDNNKLLESLQRAADVALASCRKDSRLSTIERHVSVVLRKVVQKYSNKRPDVIVIATDASEGVVPNRSSAPESISGFDQGRNKQQPWKRSDDGAKSKFFRGTVGGSVEEMVEEKQVAASSSSSRVQAKTEAVLAGVQKKISEEEAGTESVAAAPASLTPEGSLAFSSAPSF